jgi:hypothetical protein
MYPLHPEVCALCGHCGHCPRCRVSLRASSTLGPFQRGMGGRTVSITMQSVGCSHRIIFTSLQNVFCIIFHTELSNDWVNVSNSDFFSSVTGILWIYDELTQVRSRTRTQLPQSPLLFHDQIQDPGSKAIFLSTARACASKLIFLHLFTTSYVYLSVPYPGNRVKGAVLHSEVGSFVALEQRLWKPFRPWLGTRQPVG